MINGLDLFSGIGGLTLALKRWVEPVAYCENDPYAQAVLLARMADGLLPRAPVWDDVRTLSSGELPAGIDIIYGGFPCQDVSLTGLRAGLDGARSGLVSEIWRLADELRPRFIFLENVPGIVTGGLDAILASLARRGFDARWLCLSAYEVGACHYRNRWWLLARAAHADGARAVTDPACEGLEGRVALSLRGDTGERLSGAGGPSSDELGWPAIAPLCRRDDGVLNRVDRLKVLGNSVVPKCATTAFARLAGLAP